MHEIVLLHHWNATLLLVKSNVLSDQ